MKEQSISSSRRSNETDRNSLIGELVERFEKISSSIHLDLNKNSFQMMGFDKEGGHHKDDPHTQLRNIENKSEMNRAEVELLILRKPKRYNFHTQRNLEEQARESYQHIYKQYRQEKPKREYHDTEQKSEDDNLQLNEAAHAIPKNIKHFNHLRHHPRLLQYTLEKLREKNQEGKEELQKQEEKVELRKASRPQTLLMESEYKQIIENTKKDQIDMLESPKAIVQNQLTKFYSKSSKGKLDVKIRQNARCTKIMQRQQRIVSSVDETRLSKQNMKKLKQRLNEIVNEISRSDKKSSREKLPKLGKQLAF